jgi:hypothetical protein
MLATAAKAPFAAPGWIFELKYDGFRCLMTKRGQRVELESRRGRDMAASFPEVVEALRAIPHDFVIDGVGPARIGGRRSKRQRVLSASGHAGRAKRNSARSFGPVHERPTRSTNNTAAPTTSSANIAQQNGSRLLKAGIFGS